MVDTVKVFVENLNLMGGSQFKVYLQSAQSRLCFVSGTWVYWYECTADGMATTELGSVLTRETDIWCCRTTQEHEPNAEHLFI